MRDFEYLAPTTLAEAVTALATHNGSAKPLAGGTDLIDQIRIGRLRPDFVIDIKKIPELNRLEISASGLRLGAAVPCYRIYGSPEIKRQYTALWDSTQIVGGIQIQSRASVGGNLCNAGPAGDTTPSLIALGAICHITGKHGPRTVPVDRFCIGPGKNVLAPGELLVELEFPAAPANSGSAYERFIPRYEMDIAVVGVGAAVTIDPATDTIVAARIGLGAVGPTPLVASDAASLLIGQKISDELLQKAAAAAQAIATPIDDMRGTIEFRKEVTAVLVQRVLKLAIERARHGVC